MQGLIQRHLELRTEMLVLQHIRPAGTRTTAPRRSPRQQEIQPGHQEAMLMAKHILPLPRIEARTH
jgi:hypothetical protein